MYQVFDNGKPADCHHQDFHCSWDNSSFDDLEEALEHANNWLDILSPGIEVLRTEAVGKVYDYGTRMADIYGYSSDKSDMVAVIEIRQI